MATTLDKYIQKKQASTLGGSSSYGKTSLDKYVASKQINLDSIKQNLKKRDSEYQAVLKQKKKEETMRIATEETQNYIKDYKDSAEGFWGSMATRFGLGVTAPKLQSEDPEYQAYRETTEKTNRENLNRSIFGNIGQTVKKMFTENTTDSIFDTVYQEKLDAKSMSIIEENTKQIVALVSKNKKEKDEIQKNKRENAIRFLLDQNKQVAEKVGGEIKDKTTQQLIGQSVGTALELLPPMIGAGMTQAGKLVLSAGTKQAMKALGKEAVLYGTATGASEKAKEKDATTGEIATSGATGGLVGALAVMFPGITKAIAKYGDSKISNLLKKSIAREGEITEAEQKILLDVTSGDKKVISEQERGEAVQQWMSYNKKFSPEQVEDLRKNPVGVESLDYDKNGNITLYRQGYVKPGEPQSYSLVKKSGQKPFIVNKKDILVNFNSDDITKVIQKASDNPIQMDANMNALPKFQELETEVIAITKGKAQGTQETVAKSGSPILKEVNKQLDEASQIDPNLDKTTFSKQFSLAEKKIAKDPAQAYNDALSRSEGEMTKSSLQLMLLRNAIEKEDDKAIAELGLAAAITGRKAGQTSVMFRALYDKDPMSRILMNLARTKLANVEARFPKSVKKILSEGSDIVERVTKSVKKKSQVSLGDAQSIIDSFICK